MNPWSVLGIEACGDVKQIKRAYLARLKHCHPEDDQQAFIELKAAYDQALSSASYYVESAEVLPVETDSATSDSPRNGGDAESFAIAGEDYIDGMLDGFVRYSDIGAPGHVPRPDRVEIDFAEEYANCIDALMRILDDQALSSDSEAWRALFEHEILLNLNYRQYFCGELIARLKDYLEHKTIENQLTPQVILLINDFCGETHDIAKNLSIPETAMVTLSNLAIEAEKHVARVNKPKKSFSDKLVWVLWLYFSPTGRINRVVFTAAMIALLFSVPLVTTMVKVVAATNDDPLSIQSEQYQGLELGITDSQEPDDRMSQALDDEVNKTEIDAEIERMAEERRQQREALAQKKRYQSLSDFMLEKARDLDIPRLLLSIGEVLFVLAIILALIGLTVKRLHDSGRTLTSAIAIFIPAIGPLIFLVLLYAGPEKFDNKYGAYSGRRARNLLQFRNLVYKSFAAIA